MSAPAAPAPTARAAGAVLLAGLVAWLGPQAASADAAARGEAVYAARCGGCHAVDAHRVGPAHAGVHGRRAGAAPDYDYSPALRTSRVVWTDATLEAWLRDPEAVIPGQRMGYRLDDADERRAVVAFLRSLRASSRSSP